MLSRGKSLGISNLRFLPKASSLRPITNLGSAAKFDSAYFVQSALAGQREPKSVNNQLLHLFSVLKFEKARDCVYCNIHCHCHSFFIHFMHVCILCTVSASL